jgi:hypothetical protein
VLKISVSVPFFGKGSMEKACTVPRVSSRLAIKDLHKCFMMKTPLEGLMGEELYRSKIMYYYDL